MTLPAVVAMKANSKTNKNEINKLKYTAMSPLGFFSIDIFSMTTIEVWPLG